MQFAGYHRRVPNEVGPGGRIRAMREAAMLTREELADRSGVSTRTIAAVELGTSQPRLSTLAALYRTLGHPGDHADPAPALAGVDSISFRPLPRELPPVPSDLIGREQAAQHAIEYLTGEHDGADSPRVWAVAGPPGVGKTALALHVAHRVGEQFADGQYFVTFSDIAFHDDPVAAALRHLLVSSGMQVTVMPRRVGEMAAAWRSRVADRRVLIVLDDAPEEVDLTPLLPGPGPAAVLATSRRALASVPGGMRELLQGLSRREGLDLLDSMLGQERVDQERPAAQDLVELCDGLPGALRITAARVQARADQSLAAAALGLRDERSRLNLLSGVDFGVRASLRIAFDDLPALSQEALEVIGTLGGPTGPAWVVAAALDVTADQGVALIHDLADAQLVSTVGAGVETRFGVNDLTRLFGAERAQERPEQTRSGWWMRALSQWRNLTEAATGALGLAPDSHRHGVSEEVALTPELAAIVVPDPAAWFEREVPNLLAHAVTSATTSGSAAAWSTVASLHPWWQLRGMAPEEARACELLAQDCQSDHDELGRATMLLVSAGCSMTLADPAAATERLRTAHQLFVDLGEPAGQIEAALNLATTLNRAGRFGTPASGLDEAMDLARQAARLAAEIRDPHLEADAQQILAHVALDTDRAEVAMEAALRSRDLRVRSGVPTPPQLTWLIAKLVRADGDLMQARDLLRSAEQALQALPDRWGLARVQLDLGWVLRDLGEPDRARELFISAGQLALDIGHLALADEAAMALASPVPA